MNSHEHSLVESNESRSLVKKTLCLFKLHCAHDMLSEWQSGRKRWRDSIQNMRRLNTGLDHEIIEQFRSPGVNELRPDARLFARLEVR